MKQEDKELLMRDLCARLPYGVKVTTTNPAVELGVISGISIENKKISVRTKHADIVFDCTEVKPYLRPMSNMTEKEEAELYKMASSSLNDSFAIFDWLNKNYFAYRTIYNSEENKWENMFDKGLALVAHEGMYKIE